ncbi:unnamed protein product [Acanthoscelides obtectus]|uniref:Uncharacterized protein n=1 Tax=Acanthoscelides obtectus TaxID=200917 RepID=A0A9P0M545_ACAOB|nr:unnamed protein product [Acanthoscelides obtectus]CAH2006648.1 unnamed protein product [Acanthoscelides obtectus]CAK1660104.1 hypothetical protein AOBTE_LOCUS21861 [Acanthoscelides obtectus]CAK1660139.1 hypothetical protein AOBTE_LOCUS21881 [Acanthoscelides obtectus]
MEGDSRRIRFFWFLVMFFNFVFAVSGVLLCTIKLRLSEEEDVRVGFFKMSMVFASCNLILSVFLLVSILRRDERYAFLYAILIFLSLFAATIHIESHTRHDFTMLVIFAVFALLVIVWFAIYGIYQYRYANSSKAATPV